MSRRIEGRIVDENGAGVAGLRVSVRWPAMLFANELAAGESAATTGRFAFDFIPDPLQPTARRDLELVVQDEVGRVLLRSPFTDVAAPTLTRPDDVIRSTETGGLLATLGKPAAAGFSEGNAVTTLMDADAFAHAAELMRNAQRELLMSQLFFALPPQYHADATREKVKLVFDFQRGGRHLDAEHLRAAGAGDERPERLLLAAAGGGADVRILLQDWVVPLALRIIAGAIGVILSPLPGRTIADTLDFASGDSLTNIDEAHRYFDAAAEPKLKLGEFEQPALTAGFLHAKLMVVDGEHALSLGSPFSQGYVDTHDHRIDAPMRGDRTGLPMHDASFAVKGPAVADIHATMRLLWDTAHPGDPVASAPPSPPPQTTGGDGICAVQIVRTLSAGRFGPPIGEDGEKGVLEAYLRAIKSAKQYIYLETQYFTNDAIGDAVVKAMQRDPKLQVIVLLNIEPDIPLYPFKQRRLITRIREAIGENAAEPTRFAVFTRWTHDVDARGRPRVLPIYVHAKLALVDDTWATVGSANLDGYSLDGAYPHDILRRVFGTSEARAIELNAILLNTPEHPSPVVDLLRRKVWAEHLGFAVAGTTPEVPDVAAGALQAPPPGGWLGLWRDRADAKLRQLIDSPRTPQAGSARVLPWPVDDTTYKTPRKHLDALGVTRSRVMPLKSTASFDFETGQWKQGSVAEVDVN